MSDLKDEADEPSYEQLGEAGNPFSDESSNEVTPETEDEKDRAERHD